MSPAPIVSTTSTCGTLMVPEDWPETKRIALAPSVMAMFATPRLFKNSMTLSREAQPGGRKSAEQIAVWTLFRSSSVPSFQLPPSRTTGLPRAFAAPGPRLACLHEMAIDHHNARTLQQTRVHLRGRNRHASCIRRNHIPIAIAVNGHRRQGGHAFKFGIQIDQLNLVLFEFLPHHGYPACCAPPQSPAPAPRQVEQT